jgi:hypothetical protein
LNTDLRLASDLIKVISETHARIKNICDSETLALGLSRIWVSYIQKNPNITDHYAAYFYTYITLYTHNNIHANRSFSGRESLIKAISTLGLSHQNWGALWTTLKSCDPQHSKLVEVGIQWINQPRTDSRHDWTFVWQKLLEHPAELPPDIIRTTILQRGFDWLNGRENQPGWPFVWQKLLEHPAELPPDITLTILLQRGIDWLNNREAQPDWTFVWEKLLEHPAELPSDITRTTILQRGIDWLNGREAQPDWNYVWEKLLVVCQGKKCNKR